ncbi:unnamed protein product [Brassica oleracea]
MYPQTAHCSTRRTNEREGRENVHSDKNGRVCRRVVGVAEKKDNTFVYMCGLKGMEKGIDEIMISLSAKDGIDWLEYKKQLKRSEQRNVEVY